MTDDRARILFALRRFVAFRPGLEYANYGDPAAYRAEMRRITKQRHDAETLLDYVERTSITADQLRAAFRNAFSGRLSLVESDTGMRLDYCTGQYYPTEYRAAVCAVLVSALWAYWRDDYHERKGTYEGARDYVLAVARRNFRSRSIRARFQ